MHVPKILGADTSEQLVAGETNFIALQDRRLAFEYAKMSLATRKGQINGAASTSHLRGEKPKSQGARQQAIENMVRNHPFRRKNRHSENAYVTRHVPNPSRGTTTTPKWARCTWHSTTKRQNRSIHKIVDSAGSMIVTIAEGYKKTYNTCSICGAALNLP